MTAISRGDHYIPGNGVQRLGCPCQMTPTHQVTTHPEGERREVIHEFATMLLVHQSKAGEVKNALPLREVHNELNLEAMALHRSGASNILLSKVSFDCLVTDGNGEEVRDYLVFDLKVPGTGAEEDMVFSYDLICKLYGGQKHLYAAIKHFYKVGRDKGNPDDEKHGHKPSYNPNSSEHDQYIRHTEQLLVAYLALPEAAEMLCNRLRAEIRGRYPGASSVKVYNMGLHMHSTKTCCAPCEYTLLGLMNDRNGDTKHGKKLAFLPNFKRACLRKNEQLQFTLPEKSRFRFLVTVSANEADAHHQKQPTYRVKKLGDQEALSLYEIQVKKSTASTRIFTAMLNTGYDVRKLPTSFTLSDKTIAISGSKASSGSAGTINKVKSVKDQEMEELEQKTALLRV